MSDLSVTDQPVSRVLVVGATGSIGRQVVAAATAAGLRVRALARDTDRARGLLPGAQVVAGDLADAAALRAAVEGVDAVIFTHGSGTGDYEAVDYGGVAGVLTALRQSGQRARIALMTSINVTRTDAGPYQPLMDWKRRSERLVRASGLPYTVIRPGWFDAAPPGEPGLVLAQGDSRSGGVSRAQLAQALVHSLLSPTALGRTGELFAATGQPTTDWDRLFSAARPDRPGSLDAAGDPAGPPLSDEPDRVRSDIDALTAAPLDQGGHDR